MPATDSTDVMVIGAGPVGLTLACELARYGVPFRLVEKRPEPHQHPNAAIVHVRTLEILDAMGAVGGFLAEGYAVPGVHVRGYGKPTGFIDLSGTSSPYALPRTLGQQITERLLTEHLARLGGKIERSVEAVGIEQDANGVRVRLRHLAENNREETAAVRWVVGCEGSASITRESQRIAFTGVRYEGKEFLQADAMVRWTYPHGFGYQFVAGENLLLFFPYKTTGHYRIICARNDEDPKNETLPTLEDMQELVRKYTDPTAELYDCVWLNRFRSGHHLAEKFRVGRAFVAGDAGHVHVPIGGQGMNYGMHDAFNLGWKLAAVAKGEAKPELLDTYETERHPADEALIRGTDFAYKAAMGSGTARAVAMKLAGPTLLHLEVVQQRIRELLSEVRVSYPKSALTEDHGGSKGPAPGDRAPDALVVRMPQRETMSLFDIFRVPRWTLLLFAGTDPNGDQVEKLEKIGAQAAAHYQGRVQIHLLLCDDPPVPVHENWAEDVLMDRQRYAHDKYGVTSPCLYLVRPDWYVGFRAGLEHAAKLCAYLERIF